MKYVRNFLPFVIAAAALGACKTSDGDGAGGAGGGDAASTSTSAGGGQVEVCYEPTPASGDDSFVATDGANTHTFAFTLPDDPEGGLVTVTVTGRQIFANARVKDASSDSFMSVNGVSPDDAPLDVSEGFVGAPGVTYEVEVEESWVTSTEREATVDFAWKLDATRDCFEPNDVAADAQPIDLDEDVVAFLFAGYSSNEWPSYEEHEDYYTVEVETAGTLSVRLAPGPEPVALALFAAGAPETALTDGFTIDESPVELSADVEPGTYVLRVEPFAAPIYNTFDGEVTSWDGPYTLRASLE